MIFGRDTQQWNGLITATGAFILLLVTLFRPDWLPTATALVGGLGTLLGFYIRFISKNYTTPIDSPRLPSGTMVSVYNTDGAIVKQQTVSAPKNAKPLSDPSDGVA